PRRGPRRGRGEATAEFRSSSGGSPGITRGLLILARSSQREGRPPSELVYFLVPERSSAVRSVLRVTALEDHSPGADGPSTPLPVFAVTSVSLCSCRRAATGLGAETARSGARVAPWARHLSRRSSAALPWSSRGMSAVQHIRAPRF